MSVHQISGHGRTMLISVYGPGEGDSVQVVVTKDGETWGMTTDPRQLRAFAESLRANALDIWETTRRKKGIWASWRAFLMDIPKRRH